MSRPLIPSLGALVALGAALVSGCGHSDRDRAWVTRALAERGAPTAGGELGRIDPSEPLDEDSVVAVALANSPAFQVELARIDAARADLDEAGRPANPQLTVVGALGPISAFATLLAPLDSLWQLPQRTEAATRELESIAETLVQVGLDLARDARVALAEVGLAEDRVRIRDELAATWTELERIAEARVRLGDASPVESATVSAESRVNLDALTASRTDLEVARARLVVVLGVEGTPELAVRFTRTLEEPRPLVELSRLARASRPDVRAAEIAVVAAAARAGWERSRILSLAAQIEGHWSQPDVLALRAGGRIDLPIFNPNVGGVGRAEADIRRTEARLEQTRQRVVLEIAQARARVAQSQRSLTAYRAEVLPSLDEALRVASLSYELGEEGYIVVLDVLRRIGDARLREAELVAETRRADAELERAVGARLRTLAPTSPEPVLQEVVP